MITTLNNIVIYIVGFSLLLAFLGGLAFGIVRLIRSFLKIKTNQPDTIKYYILMIVCILIAIASWIFNFGWYRLIMTIFAIIHTIIFVSISSKSMLEIHQSKKLKFYTLISYITYVIPYILLPDADDENLYMFFRLIHNNNIIVTIFYTVGMMNFIANIVFMVLQSNEANKINNDFLPKDYD